MSDAYEILCQGCVNEVYCHETLDYCEAYLEMEDDNDRAY